MDIIEVSYAIQKKINKIEQIREVLKERGTEKANTESLYDKSLAIAIVKLKNGLEVEFEGEQIKNPPATIIEKIAKGICWKEKLKMQEADISYKSAITNLNAVQSELNALQSLHKYLA